MSDITPIETLPSAMKTLFEDTSLITSARLWKDDKWREKVIINHTNKRWNTASIFTDNETIVKMKDVTALEWTKLITLVRFSQ